MTPKDRYVPHFPFGAGSAVNRGVSGTWAAMVRRACLCWLSLCAAFAVSACALVPATPDPAVATQQMKARPERMIVLAVANPPETLMLRAGSTAAGYGAAGGYSPGGSARTQVTALARRYGLHEVSAWPIPSLKVHCAMLEIADGARRDEVLAQLAADPRVRLAQPLQTFDLLGEAPHGSGYSDLQQGFREIGADAAQKVTRGDSVRVAVIDTGVDTTHPDLHGRIAGTRNFVDEDWQQFNRDRRGNRGRGRHRGGSRRRPGRQRRHRRRRAARESDRGQGLLASGQSQRDFAVQFVHTRRSDPVGARGARTDHQPESGRAGGPAAESTDRTVGEKRCDRGRGRSAGRRPQGVSGPA